MFFVIYGDSIVLVIFLFEEFTSNWWGYTSISISPKLTGAKPEHKSAAFWFCYFLVVLFASSAQAGILIENFNDGDADG